MLISPKIFLQCILFYFMSQSLYHHHFDAILKTTKERIEWNSLIVPITLQNISYHSRSIQYCASVILNWFVIINTFYSVYISKHALSFQFFFNSAVYAFWLILIPKTCTFFIQILSLNRRSFNLFTHFQICQNVFY